MSVYETCVIVVFFVALVLSAATLHGCITAVAELFASIVVHWEDDE